MVELIRADSYKDLCKEVYDGDDRTFPTEGCVVYVPMDNITEFFKLCEFTNNEFTVVSGMSDYGIVEQCYNTVEYDMVKWVKMIATPNCGYNPLIIPSRHRTGFCKETDRYSIKMYTYTKDTCDFVPRNVSWFSTNLNIPCEFTHIPFGIPDWTHDLIVSRRKAGLPTERINKVYVNFQNNTLERNWFLSVTGGDSRFHVVYEPISKEDYVNDLCTYKYVLSPPGNGLDCFRTLEAIYCGAIPIIADNYVSNAYTGSCFVRYGDTESVMRMKIDEMVGFTYQEPQENLFLDYWKNLLCR